MGATKMYQTFHFFSYYGQHYLGSDEKSTHTVQTRCNECCLIYQLNAQKRQKCKIKASIKMMVFNLVFF